MWLAADEALEAIGWQSSTARQRAQRAVRQHRLAAALEEGAEPVPALLSRLQDSLFAEDTARLLEKALGRHGAEVDLP